MHLYVHKSPSEEMIKYQEPIWYRRLVFMCWFKFSLLLSKGDIQDTIKKSVVCLKLLTVFTQQHIYKQQFVVICLINKY